MTDTLTTITQAIEPITTTQASSLGITIGILIAATFVFFAGVGE